MKKASTILEWFSKMESWTPQNIKKQNQKRKRVQDNIIFSLIEMDNIKNVTDR